MFIENYVKLHDIKKAYKKHTTDNCVYENVQGWKDYGVGSSLIFSVRNNFYSKETFTEGIHSHDYYELIIYLNGDVEYINETSLFKPSSPCAVWFKPGHMHTARLISPSNYERIVFYFDRDFFEFEKEITPILDFTNTKNSFAIDIKNKNEILSLIEKIQSSLQSKTPYRFLSAKSYIIQLFLELNGKDDLVQSSPLNDDMTKIKNYIDAHFSSITNVSQVAKCFYLSREHLSRQFKKRYNICVKDYLCSRRIIESIKLLKDLDVTSCAYSVGFNSMSAFISAFKYHTGLTPSQYKKKITR